MEREVILVFFLIAGMSSLWS